MVWLEPSSDRAFVLVAKIRIRNLHAFALITRSYRENNEWRDTHSFGYDDLMNVAKLMYDAHSVITELRSRETPHSAAARQPAPNPPRPSRSRVPTSTQPRKEES